MKKKMFVKNKKVLLIVLIVALTVVLAMGTFAGTTFGLYKAEKKAVIILPGLFASGLYDSETGEAVWDPFEHIDKGFGDFMNTEGEILMENIVPLAFDNIVKEELNKMLANNNAGAEDSLFNIMAMNEDGSPAVASVTGVPWEREGRLKYGAINAQKDMYQSLYEKYGQDYEVEIFNYDFRLDNRDNAELLENHINKKKYNDIILVSHSNGGHVAGMYLAKSSENRDKVTKYISYNAPYMGAISAITILENIDGMLEGASEMITDSVPSLLQDMANNIVDNVEDLFDKQFKKLLNMWTVYHLLPNFDLLSQEYNGEQAAIYIDGQRKIFEDEEELWAFYCSRPWAKHQNGELRPAMLNWLEYVNSMKVTLPSGEKVYSPSLVDTTYYSGMGINNVNKVYFETNLDESLTLTSTGITDQGDGTVLLSSAVIMEEDESKIVKWEGVDHYGVNVDFFGLCEEDTYAEIDKSLEIKWYYKMWNNILK